jgi:hypothetical protein
LTLPTKNDAKTEPAATAASAKALAPLIQSFARVARTIWRGGLGGGGEERGEIARRGESTADGVEDRAAG